VPDFFNQSPGLLVPGFENYAVNTDGVVFTRGRFAQEFQKDDPWRPLYSWVSKHGYVRVRMMRDGKQFYRTVHSLVLLAHVGPRPEGLVIRHLNGIKTDNRLANLSYSTQKENIADKESHGTWQRGSKHGGSKLNEDAVTTIIQRLILRDSCCVIAKDYGLDSSTIIAINRGLTWVHVRPDIQRPIRAYLRSKRAA
jgi:hypothetical protein